MGTRRGIRLGVAVWLLLLVLATPLPGAAANCSPGEGTTVVVDFGALGGGVETRCASGAGTGFEALSRAGFEVTRVQSNPAFVCRIDGVPAADTEDCVDIPPATGFWSYWTADLGSEWRLATTGAAGPIRGDLEGWAFSTGNTVPPGFAVPAAPTTSTSTTTSTSATKSTTTTISSSTTTSSTTSSTTTTTTPVTTSSSTTSSSTTSTAPPTSSTGSTTTTSAAIPPPTTATASTSLPDADGGADGGEALPPGSGAGGFVVGATVVGLVAGAGILVARRRAGWM